MMDKTLSRALLVTDLSHWCGQGPQVGYRGRTLPGCRTYPDWRGWCTYPEHSSDNCISYSWTSRYSLNSWRHTVTAREQSVFSSILSKENSPWSLREASRDHRRWAPQWVQWYRAVSSPPQQCSSRRRILWWSSWEPRREWRPGTSLCSSVRHSCRCRDSGGQTEPHNGHRFCDY